MEAFRDQDLADLPIQEALDFGSYFGRHHIHPTSGAPAGFPEIHLVHRGADDTTARDFFEERTNSITWHSDVTYELQPPGTTFLYLLDGPAAGGDTLFANQAEAYRRLSPEFQKRLHGLKAVHSGKLRGQRPKLAPEFSFLTISQAMSKPKIAKTGAALSAASPSPQFTQLCALTPRPGRKHYM
jgi:alpha-ketoglutarate-dependent taurine dioxygenase